MPIWTKPIYILKVGLSAGTVSAAWTLTNIKKKKWHEHHPRLLNGVPLIRQSVFFWKPTPPTPFAPLSFVSPPGALLHVYIGGAFQVLWSGNAIPRRQTQQTVPTFQVFQNHGGAKDQSPGKNRQGGLRQRRPCRRAAGRCRKWSVYLRDSRVAVDWGLRRSSWANRRATFGVPPPVPSPGGQSRVKERAVPEQQISYPGSRRGLRLNMRTINLLLQVFSAVAFKRQK